MASSPASPDDGHLRFSAAPVFERADLGAVVITQLYRGDAFTVVGSAGEFYQVRLANGRTGFVYANNVSGSRASQPPAP